MTPVSGLTGTSTITITVTDAGSLTATKSFLVTVTPNYTSWAYTNVAGEAANGDHDHDGVTNGIEWFMGVDTPGVTTNPGPDATNKITWPKRSGYAGVYGTDFVVQTSTDLSAWTDVAGTGDSHLDNQSDHVSYTLPTGLGKVFARLVVTPQ